VYTPNSDYDRMQWAANLHRSQDPLVNRVFADEIQGRGLPGASVVRESAEDPWGSAAAHQGRPSLVNVPLSEQVVATLHGPLSDWHRQNRERVAASGGPALHPHERAPLVLRVTHRSDQPYAPGGERHVFLDNSVALHSLEQLARVTDDFPAEQRKVIVNAARAAGLPKKIKPTKLARPSGERTTNPDVLALARSYHAANKETLGLPEWSDTGATIKADSELGQRAGAAFHAMKHEPNDPAVREAYEALKKETLAQYHHALKAGYTFTPWTQPGQPYTDSADMMRDVRENKHLAYFPTDSGFGEDSRFVDHPLYDKTPDGVRFNDLFRAVHDLYAHAQHGHQFGPTGELRAWVEHARMFSPLARKALTTETHGQNSWVNFGPHEPWKVPQTERPFADQKAGLLPEAVHPPVKLAREGDRVAEDVRMYRAQIRPGLTAPGYNRPFALNGPEEHALMHKFFTNRGLKVVKGTYTNYDPDTHTFTHPNPEDRAAVARSYIQWADTPVKLAREDEQRAFHAAMAADPADRTARLVYADWLEEHGNEKAAKRLRWWAAMQTATANQRAKKVTLPDWVIGLSGNDRARRALDHYAGQGAYTPRMADELRSALAVHERQMYGLSTPAEERLAAEQGRVHSDVAFADEGPSTEGHNAVPVAIYHLTNGNHHSHVAGWLQRSGFGYDLNPHEHARNYAAQDDPTKLARKRFPNQPEGWWMDPKGTVHSVPEDQTHESWIDENRGLELHEAFHHGWQRMVGVGKTLMLYNRQAQATQDQLRAAKDHAIANKHEEVQVYGPKDKPAQQVRLARNEMKQVGPGDANRQLGSDNHAKRVELAKRVLSEAGLTQAKVSAVLAHSGARGARPAVAAVLAQADPRVAKFAAAWMGLLTGQHALTVFHPGPGEDTLHVIDSPHPSDHVGEYLRRAGVPKFTLESRGAGTRAYVVNPMDLIDVGTAARGMGGAAQSIKGSAVRLGAGSEKDARAAYRTVIDDAEREAGL